LRDAFLGDDGMLYFFLFILALYAVALNIFVKKKYLTRIQKLERELQSISGVMSQMMKNK
jgi:hypothetical protein